MVRRPQVVPITAVSTTQWKSRMTRVVAWAAVVASEASFMGDWTYSTKFNHEWTRMDTNRKADPMPGRNVLGHSQGYWSAVGNCRSD